MADAKFSFQEKGKILIIYIIQEFKDIVIIKRACMFIINEHF